MTPRVKRPAEAGLFFTRAFLPERWLVSMEAFRALINPDD